MHYSEDHKAKTHQRIIEKTALHFHHDDVDATNLQPLMKTLNLTHGNFYAHFKSKNDLVETTLHHAVQKLPTTTTLIKHNTAHHTPHHLLRQHVTMGFRFNKKK